MSDVFISYSRANAGFAHKLAEELKKRSYETWVDVVGIPFTAEWWQEIQRGIESADNFVLVMSPDSLGSPVCHLEIECARKLNKRIIPVNHVAVKREDAAKRINDRILDDAYITQLVGDRSPMMLFNANWQVIAGINWFNYPYDAGKSDEAEERHFYEVLHDFVEALNIDIVHVRQHTRLLTRAKDWLTNDRNPTLLLIGEDVTVAETWLADWERDKAESSAKDQPPKAPQPTEEVREFISASRQAEDERQRQLQALETSRQRSDTAARNARRTLTGVAILSTMILLAVVTITSNQVSDAQNQVATATVQQGQAEQNAAYAQTEVGNANATATQIPPTLTQAAIENAIIGNLANAFVASDNRSDEMLDRMTTLIEAYPDQALAYQARGAAYSKYGDEDKAIADFTEAIRLNPNYAAAYYNRGLAYSNKSDPDKAIADYTEAIRLDPNDAVAYYNRGLVYRRKNDPDSAITDFTEFIRLDPNDAGAYYNRGLAYSSKNDPDSAIADFTEVIRLNPNDAGAYYNRGLAYSSKSNPDKAIADYTEVIRLDPNDAGAYYNRGLAYRRKNEPIKAIADFTEAIRLDPNDAVAYISRGLAYDNSGDLENAIIDFTEAIRLDPNNAVAYYNRGIAYRRKNEPVKAIADYTEAIRLDPNNAVAYYNRGIAYDDSGDLENAIIDYTQAITLNPSYTDAYYNRGFSYAELKKYDLAITDFTQEMELNPDQSQLTETLLSRAYIHFLNNEPALALADFEEYERRGGIIPAKYEAMRDEVEALAQLTATPDN